MPFVPLSYSWPTGVLSPFQVCYQGSASAAVLMGAGGSVNTTFNVQPGKFEGFDLPATRNNDASRPRQRGQFIGLDLFSGRDMTLTMDVGPVFGSYSNLAGALAALKAATNTADVYTGSTEYPLYVQFSSTLGTLATMARVRRRQIPVDLSYSLANMAQNVIVQWHATDPYFYSETSGEDDAHNASIPAGGSGTFTNYGDVECYPQFTIYGPCTGPIITNTPSSGSLLFSMTVASGGFITIDTDYRSAIYTPPSGPSVDVLWNLQPGFSWFSLGPGENHIQYTSSDVAGSLGVEWASAYSSAT